MKVAKGESPDMQPNQREHLDGVDAVTVLHHKELVADRGYRVDVASTRRAPKRVARREGARIKAHDLTANGCASPTTQTTASSGHKVAYSRYEPRAP